MLVAVAEIAHQLSCQFPDDAFEVFGQYTRNLVPPDGEKLHVARSNIVEALLDALRRIKVLASGEKPLLIVVDDFDTLQNRGRYLSSEISGLLSYLHESVPRLRAVFMGRASPLNDLMFELLSLGALDAQSTDSFLSSQGVDSEAARGMITRVSSGNPLVMRLMLDLYRERGDLALFESSGGALESMIGASLLARLTSHIQDADVAKILPAAVVVRQIDPEVLRHVLAGPCGVTLNSDVAEGELFEKLAREVSVFTRKGDMITGRPDLRRLLLPLIRGHSPEVVRATNQAAIAFYEQRDSLADRAEEIYHRLATSEVLSRVELRWRHGIEDYLTQAADDLDEPARQFLSKKLGRGHGKVDWLNADQNDWEDYVEEQAVSLRELNRAEEALELLRKRSTRRPRSRLFEIEASILLDLGQPREALAIVNDGLAGTPDDPHLLALSKRCLSLLGFDEGASSADQADPVRLKVRGIAQAILRRGDFGTVVSLLAKTLPSVLDMMSAWREFGLESEVVVTGESARDALLRIVEYASRRGIVEELLVAALEYAPESPLFDFAEGPRVAVKASPDNLGYWSTAVVAGGLIFNRTLLRRFLAQLGTSARGRKVLLVDGPPGSGKNSTARIARRFAADLEATSRISIVEIALDPIPSPAHLARELFDRFGWRWEEEGDSTAEQSARAAQRFSRMISDRFSRLEDKQFLLVFEAWNGDQISEGLRDMIEHLIEMPRGPAIIVVGLTSYFGSRARSEAIEEVLEDFSLGDIVQGLERFMRERLLSGDPTALARTILESAEGNRPYNVEVSRQAQRVIRSLFEAQGDVG